MDIHPTAIVDSGAELGTGVKVGPYAIIKKGAVVGDGTEVMAHAFIDGQARLGSNCRVFPSASIGTDPQDLKYKGEPTEAVIGNDVIIREFVTVNRGTPDGDGVTRVGDGCMLMTYAHVAHDCQLGRNVVIVNNCAMAGHVHIDEGTTIGGLVGIHQFVHIGAHAFIGGYSRCTKDVPPYMLAQGVEDFKIHGPNSIGLRRKGFSRETISALKEAYRLIFRNHRPLQEALEETLAEYGDFPEVQNLVEFMRSSKRGVTR